MEEEKQEQTEAQEAPIPEPKTSRLAITSLVLSIIGALTCVGGILFGPVSLVLGIISLVQIGRRPAALRGQGLAIAGMIIGGITTLLAPILAAVMIPVFMASRESAKQTNCFNNVKQLGMAMNMYLDDNDDRFPPPESWNNALRLYRTSEGQVTVRIQSPAGQGKSSQLARSKRSIFVCPSVGGDEPTYAMNGMLKGKSFADVELPAEVVSIFESKPGKNLSGGPELLPSPPRHGKRHTLAYVDGHVRDLSDPEKAALWDPAATTAPEPDEPSG